MTTFPSKLAQTIATVEAFTGTGAHGPTWGQPADVPGRFDANKRQVIQRAGGTQVVARGTFTVRPEHRIAPQSRVVIEGTRYEALDVSPIAGPTRVIAFEVALG